MFERLQMEENFGINIFLHTALSASVNKYATLIKMRIWSFRNVRIY